MGHRFPDDARGWSATALVVLAAATSLAATGLLEPLRRGWAEVATATELVVAAMCSVSAALLYARHRVSRLPARTPTAMPAWLIRRLGVGAVALAASRISDVREAPTPLLDALAVGAGLAGGVLVLDACLAGLRFEIQRRDEHLERLDRQVEELEVDQRDQRSRLHEITNSLAGIASASTLIRQHDTLPAPQRRRLEEMIEHESARLSRILAKDVRTGSTARPAERPVTAAGRHRAVDLDQLLRPLVVAQEALGRRIEWRPSGLRAHGDPDAIAEALNILLDNSRKHAPGATTTVTVRRCAGRAEVVVSDDGPGIPPELCDRVFAWEARGASSGGQGLGLHLARTRLRESGGRLDLAPCPVGVRFVVILPAADAEFGTIAQPTDAADADAVLEAS